MQYQDCVIEVQADETAMTGVELADANINAQTGLATDYLNHFNEAIMLFEMVSSSPDCMADIHGWRPMSYREHFRNSHFKGRELALAAYASADPAARARLDRLASTMTTMIEETRASMTIGLPAQTAGDLATCAAKWLRPLVARAGAVINGEAGALVSGRDTGDVPQVTADRLMQRG